MSAPGGICYSALCPFTVTVSNSGGMAAVGTLMITSSSGGPMTVPVNIAPRGQFSTTYNAPNPAPPSPNGSVTVPIYVQAFTQVTSFAGPDVDAGKRLDDRGVDPNNPLPGNPSAYGPDVTRFLDRTTANVPVAGLTRQPDGDQVIETARNMVSDGISSRLFDTLLQLVNSPALRYGDDVTRSPLPDLVQQAADDSSPADAQQARRMLDLLKRLTAGRPPPATPDQAPVHVEDGVIYDDDKLAYRPAVITGKGNTGRRPSSPRSATRRPTSTSWCRRATPRSSSCTCTASPPASATSPARSSATSSAPPPTRAHASRTSCSTRPASRSWRPSP